MPARPRIPKRSSQPNESNQPDHTISAHDGAIVFHKGMNASPQAHLRVFTRVRYRPEPELLEYTHAVKQPARDCVRQEKANGQSAGVEQKIPPPLFLFPAAEN